MNKINGENQNYFLQKKNQLKIILDGKFNTERGRINCSLRDDQWILEMAWNSICNC